MFKSLETMFIDGKDGFANEVCEKLIKISITKAPTPLSLFL